MCFFIQKHVECICVLLLQEPQKLPDLDEFVRFSTTGVHQWLPGAPPRCFRVLLGEIENLDLDAAPGEGHGWDGLDWFG